MKFLFKFASRSRPEKFFAALDNIISMITCREEDYLIYATLDEDDPSMNNDAVKARIAQYKRVLPVYGLSSGKIGAINRDMDILTYEWDICIVMSDDFVFLQKGFNEIIEADAKKYFPDGDGFLHYPDKTDAEKIPTMSIFDKKYYDRDNYIYHPSYLSLWCDNEAMLVAQIRRRYVFINNVLFDHLHPVHKKAEWDEQYTKQQALYHLDELTFKIRQSNGFGVMLWKILVCTLEDRKPKFDRLVGALSKQISEHPLGGCIGILPKSDKGEMSIGEKRQWLLDNADGVDYISFFDDDDMPGEKYVEDNMNGVLKGVDCCSLNGIITEDGCNPKKFIHSLDYKDYFEKDNIYYRCPNHLNLIRTGYAREIGFIGLNHGEDTDFAMRMRDSGLLKTEHKIERVIYFYDYKTNK